VKTYSGWDAMGKPIPGFRKQAAYRAYQEMVPDATTEQAMEAVLRVANALERDQPFNVLGPDSLQNDGIRLDYTGRVRLIAELLTANDNSSRDPDLKVYIKRERVRSSQVASIGYSPRTRTLEVRFLPKQGYPAAHGGSVYRYGGVPRSTWEKLRVSDSPGRALNELVKVPGYPYVATRKG